MRQGDPAPEFQAEPDDHTSTVPLDDGDGGTYVISQEAVGADRVIGGGEFPDPRTPPQPPAPGSVTGSRAGAPVSDDDEAAG